MENRARVSVDMSTEEHKRLKMAATLLQISMREFILECVRDGIRQRLGEGEAFNEETLQVFRDTDHGKNLTWADNIDDAWDQLGL